MRQETPPAAHPLVGREQELVVLERLLDRLDDRTTRIALVQGEQGIGKTRLLEELIGLAELRGHLVLAGRASELESDLPYWVFVDALEEHLASVEADRIDATSRAELGRILPRFSGSNRSAGTVLDERYRAHRAVRDVLERLADDKPVTLVLDDLHWADASSVELLSGLLRRPPRAPLLLGLALRPRPASPRLIASLDLAEREGTLDSLELNPFTESEAHLFLSRLVEPHVAHALYRDHGGNPFYLEQLARNSARLPRFAWGESPAGNDVPAAIEAAIKHELDRLPAPARQFLQGAAVAGDPFEPELAAVTADVHIGDALVALDELLLVDLVRPTEAPRRFRFRHPVVRRADCSKW